jgi:hypothetical protein
MALNKREKNLAIVTGVLVLPFAIWLMVGALGGSTKKLRAQKTNLSNEIKDLKEKIRRGREAQEQLDDWNQQSLPADAKLAGSHYQDWLGKLCDKAPYNVNLRQTRVKPQPHQPLGQVGHLLRFDVNGEGSLRQLTRWLYGFYSADYLHQIKGVTIRPQPDSEKLELIIKVEALALNGASDVEGTPRPDVLPELPDDAIDQEVLDKYCEVISDRAIFSRYTPPPPEPPPETPKAPEPSRPLFDHGKYTFVTGITEVDGRPQVWLETRTSGKKFRLFEGESFEVGPVQAKIIEIQRRTVKSEVDGKQYTIALGENLREAREVGSSESSE